jgi:propanol-preferring alcohol dehydrogenase
MVLKSITRVDENPHPLEPSELPRPEPGEGELLVRVRACGVCHTELDEIEGRTPPPRLPVVPGHQVVGRVEAIGEGARRFERGSRVGVAWIYWACGCCERCLSGRENLCASFRATGRDADGGYAEYMVVPEDFAHAIPDVFSDVEAAPLLCAGAIGYRSVALAGLRDGARLGLTGFGASGHLVLKMVRHRYPNSPIHVFARSEGERDFALGMGAAWAGEAGDIPPEELDAIIDTTPVWKPVVEALSCLAPGGRLVVNAIRKEDVDQDYLSHIDYERDLWMEKEIKSVANVTREDVRAFLELAAEIPIKPDVETFALDNANRALVELKRRRIRGAKVLTID